MFDTGALARGPFGFFFLGFRSFFVRFSVALKPCIRSFFIRQDCASPLVVRFSFDGKVRAVRSFVVQ